MSTAMRAQRSINSVINRLLLLLVFIMPLVSCGKKYDEVKLQRIKDVNKSDTINIAVIHDNIVKDFMLVEGVMLAAYEINARGGLFGRQLKIKVYNSKNTDDELVLALKVAKDTTFAAVIGHRSSTYAIPASIIYDYYGLLFVAPSASNNNLTNHGFEYTFRTISSDREISKEIAVFMKMHGHKNIAIIDDQSVYGRSIADGVEESLSDIELNPVVRRHYSPNKTDFKKLCFELARHKFDAIFLGGILPYAADFIREARQMGIKQRIFGGAGIDSLSLEKIAGDAANGTVVPTSFNPDLDNPLVREFVSNFKKRYGKPPESRAASGYDSMNLLFEAMRRSKTAEPLVVVSNMRFIKDWQGVTGNHTFNLQGDVVDKKCFFKYLNQGRFIYFDTQVDIKKESGDID